MLNQPFCERRLTGTADGLWRGFVVLLITSAAVQAGATASAASFPGERTTWNGYDRFDFEVDGKPVLVVAPKQPAPGRPWVWHGEFFGHKPAPDIALLGKGFHIVYMRVPDMLGCPRAVEHWNAFYRKLTVKYGLAKKVALVGLSRGGLYCYNWAASNPQKVACIYGDAPVCDFKSWPGGKGKGKGSQRDWKLVLDCYGFKSEAEAIAYDKNPIDNLQPLAKAGVPLLHVYGDADDVVPWEENTGLVAERYRKLGGQITLITKKGVGHHPHGLEDSTPIVEFIATHAMASSEQEAEPLRPSYIPEPQPVETKILIGAHHCPLWEADKPAMWDQVVKHPERTPVLGFYSQENPEVADWETKWAVEHGISFFVYCWYRDGQGGPVKMRFASAIHDALFKSRYVSKMKFTIMWENQAKGRAGVADEEDLLRNLLPFWIENYFRHPSYLRIDNKPLLFIYRPEFLVQDLGSVENVQAAFGKMRQACREAGFAGLYLLGEYRGLDANHLRLMKSLGLDYTFAYCWHVQDNPTPQRAIATQLDYIAKTREMGILPEVVTVSQGWSGWHDEGSIWKIPPEEYQELLRKAKDVVQSFPASELGSKILLLDNWNEWSEGHYIAPHREYGFGYLDAVREVFSDAPKEHVDLVPDDIGMGPYDRAYKRHLEAGYRPAR